MLVASRNSADPIDCCCIVDARRISCLHFAENTAVLLSSYILDSLDP